MADNSVATEFSWWALGGLGEVGMNCMAFNFGGLVVPVDAGILFADPNDFGIESLHPDYSELISMHRPRHWLITHAHEDHIGAVSAILATADRLGIEPPEIWAPRFASALISERLGDDPRYPGVRKWQSKIKTITPGEWLSLGGPEVRFISVRHSTADACSLAFRWPDSSGEMLKIIHTADFKLDKHAFKDGVIDATHYDVFESARPDFLFIDSTNSERPGHSVSEHDIVPGLTRLIRQQKGRVFVTLFSSNIYRLAELLKIAGDCGRYACLAGRSLQSAHRYAEELGIYAEQCVDFKSTRLLDAESLSMHPPEKQLIICSGSQGEYRSVLAKVSQEAHSMFNLQADDAVIFSSKLIPGNERPVARLINGLLRQGAKVFWGEGAKQSAEGPIHASGHARSDEIREVIATLQPRSVVPVHGELRQLMSCAQIAEEVGRAWKLPRSRIHIVENGTRLRFAKNDGSWSLFDREACVLPPRILRFESFVSGSRDLFLQARKKAAAGGIVAVSVDSYGRCQSSVRGFLPEGDFSEEIREWTHRALKKIPHREAFSARNAELETHLADELARHLRRLTGLRPFVIFHLMAN